MQRYLFIGSMMLFSLLLSACALNGGSLPPSSPSATPMPTTLAAPSTAAPATPTPTTTPALLTTQPTRAATSATTGSLLPAPLYFIGRRGPTEQIWRIERDGKTFKQITQESAAISDFDVSPVDGSLVYVSNNTLFKADALGGKRAELLKGPALAPTRDESYVVKELTAPRWSPDGLWIVYGLNGINVIAATGGKPNVIRKNDELPKPDQHPGRPVLLFQPSSWSPDGKRLVVHIGYWGSEGVMGLMTVADGKETPLSTNDGPLCCHAHWSPDSQSVYFSSAITGMYASGLWRVEVASGKATTLIRGGQSDTLQLVAHAKALRDGSLIYFYAKLNTMPNAGFAPVTMTQSAADDVSKRKVLRSDAHVVAEALWASDGASAVIVDAQTAMLTGAYPLRGPVFYLKADDSPALQLDSNGRELRWGKP